MMRQVSSLPYGGQDHAPHAGLALILEGTGSTRMDGSLIWTDKIQEASMIYLVSLFDR